MNMSLQREASFINLIKDGSPIVWDNVIIVVREPTAMSKLNKACQGALAAVKELAPDADIKTLGFKFESSVEDKEELADMRKRERKRMFIVSDEELRSQITSKIGEIGSPIQVIFKDNKCLVKSDNYFILCNQTCVNFEFYSGLR